MNSGQTAERVYRGLRALVVDGEFVPGERLDPAKLADRLYSSVTPVRDALHLLVGERLVETGTGEGFHLPQLSAPALEDLYDFTGEVLAAALRARRAASSADDSRVPAANTNADYPARVASIFDEIASRSSNREHGAVIASLNARLAAVRAYEPQFFPDAAIEVDDMCEALIARDLDGLRKRIGTFHRRRRRAAAELVRARYRRG